jgi:hypothetical protein
VLFYLQNCWVLLRLDINWVIIHLLVAMNNSDTGKIQEGSGNVVQHVVYKVPRKNHESMVRLIDEANEIFRENGGLRHEVFQLSKLCREALLA